MTRNVRAALACLAAFALVPALAHAEGERAFTLERLSTHHTGLFDEGAADLASQRLFVVNAQAATLDVLDLSEPAAPVLADSLDMTHYGTVANSVAVHGGLVAVAIESEPKTDPGSVVFFDARGELLGRVEVGALPDMLIFTPDGARVLVANEGEPCDDYATDPAGSITLERSWPEETTGNLQPRRRSCPGDVGTDGDDGYRTLRP